MNKIAEIALSYVGQREKSPNLGFKDEAFEKKMKLVGFYSGAAWCLFFGRLVWFEGGFSIKKLSASSYLCAKNNTDNWHDTPIVGAIAIFWTYKNGKYQGTGHGCIVVAVPSLTEYTTVDGNTTDKGGREGVMVAVRNRHLNKESWTKDGLQLKGFIYPIELF